MMFQAAGFGRRRHDGSNMTGLRSLIGLALVATLVAGCVPTPANRPSPTPPGPTAPATPTPVPTPAGPTPIPSFIRPTPTPLPTFLAYTVRPGDNLESIARAFRTDVLSLAFWNRVAHPSLDPDSPTYRPNHVEAGWTLVLVPDVKVDPEDFD